MRSDRHIQALLLVALAATPARPSSASRASSPSFEQARRAAEAQSLIDAGLENLQRARYEQAIDAFRRAVDLSPDLAIAWYDLGVAYFGLQRFEDSRESS